MRDLIYAVYWWGDARSYICCILVGWWEILYMLYTGGVMGDLIYAVYWWGDGRSYICCILVG